VECWQEETLAGGLYGVALGRAFFGESMFSTRPDASKVALVALVEELRERAFEIIDCQVSTMHLVRMGAREIPRDEFLQILSKAVEKAARLSRRPLGRGSGRVEKVHKDKKTLWNKFLSPAYALSQEET
jgi:leucyl/phenylalanyl-tRNA--protein transferase